MNQRGKKPGSPRTGGRKKGTPNKLSRELLDLLDEELPGFDPVLELAKLGMDKNTPLDLRAKCLQEVGRYCRPQRRAIEVSGPEGGAIAVQLLASDAGLL